jgi:threonine/homoserine/homoserine lactone efflux protein
MFNKNDVRTPEIRGILGFFMVLVTLFLIKDTWSGDAFTLKSGVQLFGNLCLVWIGIQLIRKGFFAKT